MIGSVIKQAREKKHWNISELACRTNVAPSTISRIESNKTTPTFETLTRIVKVLNT